MPKTKRPLILTPSSPLDKALDAFKSGGIIAYPTETFYGLGVDPFNREAVKKLFILKGRSPKNPFSIIIKDREMLNGLAAEVPPLAEGLIKRFWPGPLTIIFRALPIVPPELIGDTGKIAVRVSSSPIAQKLVEALNSPITATSANPSGKNPPVTAASVVDYFNGSIDILIDGGTLGGRAGSTIVDIMDNRIEIIREGEIPARELRSGD